MIHLSVIQSVKKMNGARARCSAAEAKFAGQLGLRPCSKRPRLLMPYLNEFDVILATNGLDQCVNGIARHAEHVSTTGVGDHVEKNIGDKGFKHQGSVLVREEICSCRLART